MPEEITNSAPDQQGSEQTAIQSEAAQVPQDFREYAKWRVTGELPQEKDPPAAAPDEAQAKTEPASEPDVEQEPEEKPEENEEEEDDETPDAATPPRGGSGGSRQRRIEKLTRQIEELQRVIAGTQQAPPAARPPQQTAPVSDDEPKLENFETLQDHQRAHTRWMINQYVKEQQEAAQRAAAVQLEQTLQSEWSRQEKDARKAHADYDDVVESIPMPKGPIVLPLRQAILEDANGAEVLYFLARNPKELARIASLSPVSAVREIGKLSAKFSNGNSTAPENTKTISTAPRPPKPIVRPAAVSPESIDDPAVLNDFRKYARLRTAQRR